MSLLKIYNAQIITPHRIIAGGSILIENGLIVAVSEGNIEKDVVHTINAHGNYVSPGFIDIHVHGGGGHDFMDCTVDAFLGAARMHACHGTTSMMPTTLSCERDELLTTLGLYSEAHSKNENGAQFVGMHIEGPYFAMNQRGAQDPRYIREPDPIEYESIANEFPIVKRWSAAPEINGALEFARFMRSRNILPSLAHTDAMYEEVIKGFEAGYTLATHLYSGMSSVTRRNAFRFAGAVESAFLIDEMSVEIIADGCHLPEPLLRLVYKIKGADRIALITDAMRGAGMPQGESLLGSINNGLKVIIEDGVAKLPDRSSFAGSVATADRLVRTMNKIAGVPLADAVKMISATPARILGINQSKGSLSPGMDADIVIFDEDVNILATMIRGKIIFETSSTQNGIEPIRHERSANLL